MFLRGKLQSFLQRLEDNEAQLVPFGRYQDGIAQVNSIRRKLRPVRDSLLTGARAGSKHEAIAAACEASRRALGLDPFDEQIGAALAMTEGHVVEMQTGEGKTLAAMLAVSALLVLSGSVHVLTANDYLARRDAAWMRPAYELLGVRAAGIGQDSTAAERRAAYLSDVLYATPNEVGFDLLRDQLALEPGELVQTGERGSVLVDEADSILIDEARIPLVIAGGRQEASAFVRPMARLASQLEFSIEDGRNARLTARGIAKVEAALGIDNLFAEEGLAALIAAQEAVHAHALLQHDVDYVVKNGGVEQVDRFKGRIAADRRWPADLQWAVEAKEGVTLQPQGRILGSLTLADLVRLYPHRCGMTGTAATQAIDLWREYGLRVAVVPPHKPCVRVDHPDRVFPGLLEKDGAVVEEIKRLHARRQPVLVGTGSVRESERLSARLALAGIAHQLLNARQDQSEAAIIAEAGRPRAVTISTNMAGRGTDIRLGGSDESEVGAARQVGGLAVIGTTRHEARRIDHQLRGRAGRQGDPGSSQFFLSQEDEIFAQAGAGGSDDLDHLQRTIEGEHLTMRLQLRKYTGVVEAPRRQFADWRDEILHADPADRAATLTAMDELWAEYLELASHLRSGLAWRSWTREDPLPEYRSRLNAAFEELRRLVKEGDWSERAATFERGATWTYLLNDFPLGTPSSRLLRHYADKIARRVRR